MTDFLKEYRCTCGKLLFKASLGSAVVEIKCKRCGALVVMKQNQADGVATRNSVLKSHMQALLKIVD